MNNSNWIYNKIDEYIVGELARKLSVNTLLMKVLFARGYCTEEEIKGFLTMWKTQQNDTFLMKDMEKCVFKIKETIRRKDKITVYGDYDCDGITATAVLVDFLRNLGADVDYYIPDRIKEGYGLSFQALDKILNNGTNLIITVDCGITAIEETKYINGRGASIIVTDHHKCQKEIPDAAAVINPQQQDCYYPFKKLAGVGVVYKLIQALCEEYDLGNIYNKYIELVTLGTVADVVSITGENKKIVSMGIDKISNTNNLGLKALVEISNTNKYRITSQYFSYSLSPRINAAGRMGNANLAIELIMADNKQQADRLALLLENTNKKRQEVEADNLNRVLNIIKENQEIANKKIIIVSSSELHIGVVGIVAAKISEKYNKPCILLVEENNKEGRIIAKGSARSIEGVNIYELLSKCSELLSEFGGHTQAAGITVELDKLDQLTIKLDELIGKMDEGNIFQKTIKADIMIDIDEITEDNIRSLEMMEPFGNDNEIPVFVSKDFILKNIRVLGTDGKHLKFTFFKNGRVIDAVAFNMGHRKNEAILGNSYNIIYNLENNEWRNVVTPQMKLIDFTV